MQQEGSVQDTAANKYFIQNSTEEVKCYPTFKMSLFILLLHVKIILFYTKLYYCKNCYRLIFCEQNKWIVDFVPSEVYKKCVYLSIETFWGNYQI